MKRVDQTEPLDQLTEQHIAILTILKNGGSYHYAVDIEKIVFWNVRGCADSTVDEHIFGHLKDLEYIACVRKMSRHHPNFPGQDVEIYTITQAGEAKVAPIEEQKLPTKEAAKGITPRSKVTRRRIMKLGVDIE